MIVSGKKNIGRDRTKISSEHGGYWTKFLGYGNTLSQLLHVIMRWYWTIFWTFELISHICFFHIWQSSFSFTCNSFYWCWYNVLVLILSSTSLIYLYLWPHPFSVFLFCTTFICRFYFHSYVHSWLWLSDDVYFNICISFFILSFHLYRLRCLLFFYRYRNTYCWISALWYRSIFSV